MVEPNSLINGDMLDVMPNIENGSIDLIVTSPPYDNLRSYESVFDLQGLIKQIKRVLKQGGVCVWIVGDQTKNYSESGTSFKQALSFMEQGLKLYDTMIFQKNNYIPLTHRRYEQSFEYMFVFSKGRPKTFNPLMRNNKYSGMEVKRTFRQQDNTLQPHNTPTEVKEQSIKPNIWNYDVGYMRSTTYKKAHEHPAIFPEAMVADHIESWSNKGDIVLDMMMGSGTTPYVAKKLDRQYIGIELDEGYYKIAKDRIGVVK